jgi:large subunit ribosomal protein L25
MEKTTITLQKRLDFGHKSKKLRRAGILPVGLYGKGIKSVALSIPLKDFLVLYKKVGETGLVEIKVDKENYHALIRNVQIDPVGHLPLHIEFQAVSLLEKIKANIPVELIGESPAVKDQIGILLQTVNEIEVEALPTDLPDKIEVNVESLTAVDQHITVADLPKLKGVEVLTVGTETIVKVAAAVSEEAKKEAEEAAAKAAEVVAEGTPTEGAIEGEKPATEAVEQKETSKETEV